MNNFYVYVYIDPRSLEAFYYGKGTGNRKNAHLHDSSDSEKAKIIKEINKAGLEPIIKIVARGLTEDQALLVEKTLLWKLGRTLTNKSTGHFKENFRPQNTWHTDIFGFDFENDVYCLNVGEGGHRNWDDCKKYGFISAGQDWEKWGRRICELRVGDVICAYVSGKGYVGVGKVVEAAVPATEFKVNGELLSKMTIKTPEMFSVENGLKNGEFVVKIRWAGAVDRDQAVGGGIEHWRSRSMLGSLENQPKTLKLLEEYFKVSFANLLSSAKKAA